MRFRLALALCLAIGVAACGGGGGGGDSKGTDVVMWHGYDDVPGKTTKQLVDEYNASKPGFTVKARNAGPSDDALAKTLTSLTAGNFPDTVYLFGSDLANVARSPKSAPWNAYIKAHPEFKFDDFFPAIREAATVEGKVVGLPALVDNLAIVYNKKLFAAAGVAPPSPDWTWADFRDAARKLTDKGKRQYGWAYPISGDEDTTWRFTALLWQAGGDVLSADNTKAEFDSAAGVKALTLLKQMAVDDGSVYRFQTSDSSKYLSLFNGGKIAMLWTGPWDLGSINKDVDYGVQILPGDQNHSSIAGPDMWVTFNRGAKHLANAQKFLASFTSAKTHLKYAIETGDLPIRESETELPDYKQVYLKKFPQSEIFVRNLEENVKKARPAIAQYPDVSKAIGDAVAAVMLGRASPQQALQKAADDADAALAGGP